MKTSIKNLTTEEKLDLLTRDFLERDGDHFVRIRRSGRLGWENALPEDAIIVEIARGEGDDDRVITVRNGKDDR